MRRLSKWDVCYNLRMNHEWRQLPMDILDPIHRPAKIEYKVPQDLVSLRNYFIARHNSGELDVATHSITARDYVWQYVDYMHKRPESHESYTYRGYLMVEPVDIMGAVTILDEVLQERRKEGKKGNFKWLMMKMPNIENTDDWWRYAHTDQNIGVFRNLHPIDPRVVIYESNPDAVQDIFTQLAAHSNWRSIERERRDSVAHYKGEPPIRGSNCFIDPAGVSWFSLSYNAKSGHSHTQ